MSSVINRKLPVRLVDPFITLPSMIDVATLIGKCIFQNQMYQEHTPTQLIIFKMLGDISCFYGATDIIVCPSGDICPGCQALYGFLACMLPRLCAMDSSDSSLV